MRLVQLGFYYVITLTGRLTFAHYYIFINKIQLNYIPNQQRKDLYYLYPMAHIYNIDVVMS